MINEYIRICKREISAYIRTIFKSKYNKEINEIYMQHFIELRYYNIYYNELDGKDLSLKKYMPLALISITEKVVDKFPKDELYIYLLEMFYKYIVFFDNVYENVDYSSLIDKIVIDRENSFKGNVKNLKEELTDILLKYRTEKIELLARFDCEDFRLKFSRTSVENVYNAELVYSFEFPEIYNKNIIKKVFCEGTVAEDKCKVLYNLLVSRILHNNIKGIFNKQYIVEFKESLLKKEKKLKAVLDIIDKDIVKETISLSIMYQTFINNKDKIYELIRSGYKFALVLDEKFQYQDENVMKLQVFNFIMINKNAEYYEELKEKNNNIITI